jgi:hypothetical protein
MEDLHNQLMCRQALHTLLKSLPNTMAYREWGISEFESAGDGFEPALQQRLT